MMTVKELFSNYGKPVGMIAGCLALCLGMYYGADLLAQNKFRQAVTSADSQKAETRMDACYFNTLTAKEQMLYDAVVKAAKTYETQTAILSFVPSEAEYRNAMRAVLLDNPNLFYIISEQCTLITSKYTAAVELSYCELPEARLVQLSGAVDKIIAKLPKEDTWQTAFALHDALAAKCSYIKDNDSGDVNALQNDRSTAYDALVLGYADGYGYALAYQLLCDACNIPCETVTGTVDGVAHAWNAVTLDDTVGYTDVMWDDVPLDQNDVSDPDSIVPFHGYAFLSYDEMTMDHLPDDPSLWKQEDTQNYYERNGYYANNAEALPALMETLIMHACRTGEDVIEFAVGEMLSISALEEYLHEAVTAANLACENAAMRLRTVNRIYLASDVRCAVTVRLFYEEDSALTLQTADGEIKSEN